LSQVLNFSTFDETAADSCSCGCSTWFNRDLPGGVGDYEVTDTVTNPTKPCPSNYVVQTRVTGTTQIFNSPQEVLTKTGQKVKFVVNAYQPLGVGMYCANADNSQGCLNFEARFCCGEALTALQGLLHTHKHKVKRLAEGTIVDEHKTKIARIKYKHG
jgi:hypothetical protein